MDAQTTATSAMLPLVIHILVPDSTQSEPSRRARVLIPGRVRAVIRLGQAEAADGLARRHPRQPLSLLLLGAVLPDRVHGQRALHRDHAAQPGVGRFELAAGDAVGDRAHPGASVARQVHAEQAQLAEFGHEVAGERTFLEPFGDVRLDPVGREVAHRVTDQPLVRGQLVVNPEQVDIGRLRDWPDV